MPLSGGILLANMMVDEVIVGAPGSGLFGMLLFCVVAVFLSGLMIGRIPEYVGKKIRSSEVKMTLLALIAVPLPRSASPLSRPSSSLHASGIRSAVGSYLGRGRGSERRSSRDVCKVSRVGRRNCRDFGERQVG